MTEALALIQAINAALTVGINVREAIDKLEALRAESGGSLTQEQLEQLEKEARASQERM